MQKITILAVLLSIITISVTLELVAQDYIQKVRPEIEETVEASVLKLAPFTDYIESQQVIQQASQAQEVIDQAQESRQEEEAAEPQETPQNPTSVRLDSLLPALDISRLQYESQTPTTTIFNLIQLPDLDINKNVYGFLRSNGDLIGSISEITSENQKESQQIYQEIKAIAGSFREFSINETNEFGTNSFYVNPAQENEDAFLVMHKGNLIYALAYNKDLHPQFKEWFELLL